MIWIYLRTIIDIPSSNANSIELKVSSNYVGITVQNLRVFLPLWCARHIQSLRLRANSSVNWSKTTATIKPWVGKGVVGIIIVVDIIIIINIISMQVYSWLLCQTTCLMREYLKSFLGYNWRRARFSCFSIFVSHRHKLVLHVYQKCACWVQINGVSHTYSFHIRIQMLADDA